MKYLVVVLWLSLGGLYYWVWYQNEDTCCVQTEVSMDENVGESESSEIFKESEQEEEAANKAISQAAETKTITSIKSTSSTGKSKLTFYFPSNSSSAIFSKETEANLKEIVKQVSEGSGRVVITGHTDTTGDTDSNRELGKLRAEDVKKKLVSNGLDASKVIALSMGEEKPIAPNSTADGRQRNRRVELLIE